MFFNKVNNKQQQKMSIIQKKLINLLRKFKS